MNGKARIIFFHRTALQRVGVMSVSSILRKHGYSPQAVIVSKQALMERLRQENGTPAVICYSAMTMESGPIHRVANEVRSVFKNGVFQILGGPHATYYPDRVDLESFDAACVGEGEKAIVPLVERFINGGTHQIDNIVDRGHPPEILKMAPLLKTGEIPMPDMDLYDKRVFLKKFYFIASSRRCPHRCTFCHNSQVDGSGSGNGGYFTSRAVDSVMEEMHAAIRKLQVKGFGFFSDVLFADGDWAWQFLRRYALEIRLPFRALARADQIDEHTARLLSQAGCIGIEIGIETANEERRNTLLHKKITNNQIIQAVSAMKKHEIQVSSSNMIGLPHEKFQEAMETIRFARSLGLTTSWFGLCVPYPRTELGELAMREGLLPEHILDRTDLMNPHYRSILKQEQIRRIDILHKFSYILFRFRGRWLEKIVSVLSKGPFLTFYYVIYRFSFLFFYWKNGWRLTLNEKLRLVYCAVVEKL